MKIFSPGPVNVREEILNAMSVDIINHRSKDASIWQKEITDNLRKIWNTEEEILVSTSSGTGLMEGALSSCITGRLAIFSSGAFGNRFYKIAKSLKIDADLFEGDWNRGLDINKLKMAAESGKYQGITITHNETSSGVMEDFEKLKEIILAHPEILWIVDSVSATGGTPLNVDDIGIDIAITSSQKCLGLPPALAFCTFSKKARDMAEKKEYRGYYFDLIQLSDYTRKNNQYPSTPAVSIMNAAREQLKYIVEVESVENRYKRHKELKKLVHQWVKENGKFYADEDYRSDTVTVIKLEDKENIPLLLEAMKDKGYHLAGGYGKLKEDTFRIAHMADKSLEEMEEMLEVLTEELNRLRG